MSIVLNEDEEIGSVNKFREMISEYEIALKKSNENISTLKERICQLMKENSLLKTKLKKAKEDIKEELSEKIELLKQLEKINKNHLFVPTVTSSICQSPCSSCLKVQKENNEIIQSLTNIVTHLLKHNDKDIAKNIIASSLSSSFSITFEDMTKELLSLIDEEQSAMINQFKSEIALRRKIHERYMTLRGKMRVMVRLRPLLSQESSSANKKYLKNTFNIFDNTLSLSLPKKNTKYEFDYIFDHRSEQSDIYDEVKMLIENIFRENNIVIIAYGQTNSGKSYTIDGDSNNEHDGILIRAIKDLFAVRKAHSKKKISISITIIEVYNDIIYNLLINEDNIVEIYENTKTKKTSFLNLDLIELNDIEKAKEILEIARNKRKTNDNTYNIRSSRSHCVYTLYVSYIDGEKKKNTRVDFVDLSGSERLAKRDVVDELTKKESLFINKSLSSLNNVLNAIRIKSKHIPYRDSKLTFYLKESITKSVNILLILQCSPKSEDESETICTLDFGSRFCNVVGYDSGRERLLTTKHNRSYSTNNTNGNL